MNPILRSTGFHRAAARALSRQGWTAVAARQTAVLPFHNNSHNNSHNNNHSRHGRQLRGFSSSSSHVDGLSDMLSREHAEELENGNDTMPDALATLKSGMESEGWKIVDSDSETRLIRSKNAQKMQISFHCQDTTDSTDYGDDDDVDDVEDDEDHEPEYSSSARFLVTVTKAGKSLVMTCSTQNDKAIIQGTSYSSTDVDKIHAEGGIPDTEYQGPEFDELATDLQDVFHDYLEFEVGVHNNVSAFICMYIDYKEQQQYIKWLNGVKAIIN